MRELICEGACNPTLHTFDSVAGFYGAAVINAAIPRDSDEVQSLLDLVVVERKKLKHTAHGQLPSGRWACGTCGAERKYGAGHDTVAHGLLWRTA